MNKTSAKKMAKQLDEVLKRNLIEIEVDGLPYSLNGPCSLFKFTNPEGEDGEAHDDYLFKVEGIVEFECESFSTYLLVTPESAERYIEEYRVSTPV